MLSMSKHFGSFSSTCIILFPWWTHVKIVLAFPVVLGDSHYLVIKIGETQAIPYSQASQGNQRRYWNFQRADIAEVKIQVLSMARKFPKSKNHFITETGWSQIVALIEGDTCVEVVKINIRNAADLIVINFAIWFEIQVFSWMSLQYWISLQILTEIISYNLHYLLSRRS